MAPPRFDLVDALHAANPAAYLASRFPEHAAANGIAADRPLPVLAEAWAAIPAVHRRNDDGTLRNYVDAMLTGAAVLDALARFVNYRPVDEGGPGLGVPSLLASPGRTPWPEWLAQALGVNLARAGIVDPYSDDAARAIVTPVNGWRAGSRQALAEAARRTLTGNRIVRVRAQLDPDPWIVTVSTIAAETPDPTALETAVRRVKPAGVELAFDNDIGNWAGIEALPTWAALEAAAPTWADVEDLYA